MALILALEETRADDGVEDDNTISLNFHNFHNGL